MFDLLFDRDRKGVFVTNVVRCFLLLTLPLLHELQVICNIQYEYLETTNKVIYTCVIGSRK